MLSTCFLAILQDAVEYSIEAQSIPHTEVMSRGGEPGHIDFSRRVALLKIVENIQSVVAKSSVFSHLFSTHCAYGHLVHKPV